MQGTIIHIPPTTRSNYRRLFLRACLLFAAASLFTACAVEALDNLNDVVQAVAQDTDYHEVTVLDAQRAYMPAVTVTLQVSGLSDMTVVTDSAGKSIFEIGSLRQHQKGTFLVGDPIAPTHIQQEMLGQGRDIVLAITGEFVSTQVVTQTIVEATLEGARDEVSDTVTANNKPKVEPATEDQPTAGFHDSFEYLQTNWIIPPSSGLNQIETRVVNGYMRKIIDFGNHQAEKVTMVTQVVPCEPLANFRYSLLSTVIEPPSEGELGISLIFRSAEAQSRYYMVRVLPQKQTYNLYLRLEDGTLEPQYGTSFFSDAIRPNRGELNRFEVEVTGSRLTFLANGESLLTSDISKILDSGTFAFGLDSLANQTVQVDFDDITIEILAE